MVFGEIIPGAQKWFRKTEKETTVNMVNVVDTDVDMNPVSPSNMLPSRVRRYVNQQTAVKIILKTHIISSLIQISILDEIMRRDALEYDPSRVFVGGEAESESENEDEEI